MTNFTHEEYLITHIALGFNDEPLGEDDADNVKVTIYDANKEPLAAMTDQVMEWNPLPKWKIKKGTKTISGQGWWEKLWDTAEIDVGASWQAKCVLTSPTGGESIEYLRIRLKTDPLPVA